MASNIISQYLRAIAKQTNFVTTDKGFSILDYQQKRFKNYEELPLSCINENALYKTKKEKYSLEEPPELFLSSRKNLKNLPRSYCIYPFRLIVNGKDINVGDKDSILTRDITYTPKITL